MIRVVIAFMRYVTREVTSGIVLYHDNEGKGCGFMNLSRRSNKQFRYIALVSGFIFLSYLVLTPPVYNQTGEMVSGISLHGSGLVKQTSLITSVFTESELLTDVVAYHIINRSQQASRQLPILVSCTLAILLSGYGILVHNSQCPKRETNQHTSLLAISRGGHAPPLQI